MEGVLRYKAEGYRPTGRKKILLKRLVVTTQEARLAMKMYFFLKMDMTGELASKGCLKDSSNMQIRYRAQGVALSNQSVKSLPAMQESQVQSLGQEDPLEKEMATHSSILAWRIPWTEEPSGLRSVGSQRV